MNLKHLTDDTLLLETEKAARREREALAYVLHHIREVDRRRLYSKLKYQSLADYMIKHLKYTEDQAWPRISAMKLLKEIPELEVKINEGSLSLSNLNLARRAFAQEEKRAKENHEPPPRSFEEKIAVLEKLENVSKREAEKIVRAETGVILKSNESVQELSDGTFDLTVNVTKEDLALIKELKGRMAHSRPQLTDGQLLKLALEALKEKFDPSTKAVGVTLGNSRVAARPVPEQFAPIKNSRYIPAGIRHSVWLRDGGACTNCGSTHAVQYEHMRPVALGGKSTMENLKLLCRSCNQRSAIEAYGTSKISRFLRSPGERYFAGLAFKVS